MTSLDSYFSRIQYAGPLSQGHDTLVALMEHHLAAIPFEAIDVLLDKGIDISPEAVDAKLIDRQRGGYCFEHNSLFARVLEALGFEVERLAARVLWGSHTDAPPLPRTHMALRVRSDDRDWLVDVGFGGACPVAPLALDTAEAQSTFLEPFRVVPNDEGWLAEVHVGEHWKPMYALSRVPLIEVDYVPLNWYTSTHPGSPFKQHMMGAIVNHEGRYSLLDNRLTIRQRDGSQTSRALDAAALESALVEHFGLRIEPDWLPLLDRLATR